MDDLEKNPEAGPPEEVSESRAQPDLQPDVNLVAPPAAEMHAELVPGPEFAWAGAPSDFSREDLLSRRRSFRHNLQILLSLTLAAFTLTAWILVRVDSPFGLFSTGPQEVARAQLRALDRGELRPAYDMFSPRYRQQVSFDVWHELITTHWRMFHAEVLRTGASAQSGPRATLEMYLRGADDKTYRARFTLIRQNGRWWIDDVHWAEEGRERDFIRS
jgi:hypothetical protein